MKLMLEGDGVFPLDQGERGEVEHIVRVRGAHASRRQKKRKGLLVVFVVLFLALASASGCMVFTYLQHSEQDYTGTAADELERVNIKIPKGATVTKIAQILVDNNVIASAKSFIKVSDSNPKKTLSYGTFVLKKHLSAASAFEMLLNKSNLLQIKFTIPEGYTVKQIVETIKKDPNVQAADIDRSYKNAPKYLPAEANGNLEGWLFPATYTFDCKTTVDEIFKSMINKTVDILKKYVVTPGNYQTIITKASIIQRETEHKDDMLKVARVIENRLAIDIKLEMDSINAYGINGGESKSLELSESDLKNENDPYNSRVKKGLPPTPISSPGEDAISSAVKPAEGPWMYFCTVNPDTGETEFSVTETEFNASKAKYKQWLDRQ